MKPKGETFVLTTIYFLVLNIVLSKSTRVFSFANIINWKFLNIITGLQCNLGSRIAGLRACRGCWVAPSLHGDQGMLQVFLCPASSDLTPSWFRSLRQRTKTRTRPFGCPPIRKNELCADAVQHSPEGFSLHSSSAPHKLLQRSNFSFIE